MVSPCLCGDDASLDRSLAGNTHPSPIDPSNVRSAFAIALHMHQPLIPAGAAGDARATAIISNLQFMMEHPEVPDSHNASVFIECYRRMGTIIPRLVAEGCEPRVMLDYSGCLLHGLRLMGRQDVLDALRPLAVDPALYPCVEWLGTAWGHAVAPSTPPEDFRLHVRAWQHDFAATFGGEALSRVRGFSPPEMALPNDPDTCHAFVRTLVDCGYRWVLVQEHTVERAEDGAAVRQPHVPHRLVARDAQGRTATILAIVKTQGSDTKLVAQMQPASEAGGLTPVELGGRRVPQLVTQIGDGENGGVMMNEFVPKYEQVMRETGRAGSAVRPMNVSEYLAHLAAAGVRDDDLPAIRPRFHHRIWSRFEDGAGPARMATVLDELRREDHQFNVEGGSWTNDVSWVRGYEGVLGPMGSVSARFHERFGGGHACDPRYAQALYHLLLTQTSCFRYWGQGAWTDYARELCRRAMEAIDKAG